MSTPEVLWQAPGGKRRLIQDGAYVLLQWRCGTVWADDRREYADIGEALIRDQKSRQSIAERDAAFNRLHDGRPE